MNPNIFASIPEQPFLLLLWIMMCYTLVFFFVIEVIATIWVIAEFRFRRQKLKMEQEKQALELEHLQQQSVSHPAQRNVPVPQHQVTRRSMRRSSDNQDDWH